MTAQDVSWITSKRRLSNPDAGSSTYHNIAPLGEEDRHSKLRDVTTTKVAFAVGRASCEGLSFVWPETQGRVCFGKYAIELQYRSPGSVECDKVALIEVKV